MALNKVTQNNRNAVCNTPDNAHIARGGDVNPIVDAMNDLLTAGAVTQATSVTTGVTLNSKSSLAFNSNVAVVFLSEIWVKIRVIFLFAGTAKE